MGSNFVPMRVWTDLRKLRRAFADLKTEMVEDEQASYELAQSAQRFSRETKAQVDDKLSFSAVLMRAGEADAANRLIEELEEDVRVEEAALFEQMNEIRIARVMRRDRVTRARLARVLVTAIVGAGMMAFSAIGMAVAGMMAEADRTAQISPEVFARGSRGAGSAASGAPVADGLRRKMKKVKIANAEVLMNKAQLRMLEKITTGTAGGGALDQLLSELHLPPELAAEVRKVLTAASTVAAEASPAPVEVPETDPVQPKKKKSKKKNSDKQSDPASDPQGPTAPPGDEGGDSSGEGGDSSGGGEGGDSSGEGEKKEGGTTPQLPGLPQ